MRDRKHEKREGGMMYNIGPPARNPAVDVVVMWYFALTIRPPGSPSRLVYLTPNFKVGIK